MNERGPELAAIIRDHQAHNDRFYGGQADAGYWAHDGGVTIHGGFGGSAEGWETIAGGLERAAGRLSDGTVVFTPIGGRVVGDLAYVAGVERGEVRVDGGEPRQMEIRVTTILERIDGKWRCVHRHGEMVEGRR